ncbi:MAG: hypothetical protein COT91_05340 [Candidatus Doudnabacteria bacterium CG10_big_fil_rev_8_21_14_0_10_41_10]|uniref:Uncharacterized protein n=1 Tax=Candidatus Doudnabacteria bacterium CG10_big_fil_rev_8_21_14_0_10_41_10 TaxID=1974551 RepID=A0A2H0VC17_9BACT|nr:MAG: hypothetical protein COT91_05340 [Candidatus Doudnabacteria bacterium CG10_big_fil_rev_8_21_14_0_10_41_10]
MSVQKIFLNTILQSVGKVISVAIGLGTIAFLTRFLGDEGFGEYTTVIAFMGFFGILADLGLYLVTTQEISREGADESKILGNVFFLRFLTVVTMLVIGAVLALFFPYSAEVKQSMFLAIVAFAFVSGTQVLVGVFQKHLIFYKLIGSEIIQRLVNLGLVVLFIKQDLGILHFILALAVSNGVHFFISMSMAQRITPFTLQLDFAFWKNILAKSWPLGFSVVLNLIYFRADTLILSYFKPPTDVGVYGLSYKILEVLMAFPAMFAGLIMPFLARYAFKEWSRYKKYLQNSLNAMFLVIVPMIIVTLFFARPIINLVGGDGFVGADKVLQILIFATALIYLGNLFGYTVVALNAQKKMLWGYGAGAVVGLLLYFVLIPRFSYFGAAFATLAVELIVFIFAYLVTGRASNFYPSISALFKALLAAIPMVGFFYYVQTQWVAEALSGLAIYTIFLFILKAVPRDFISEVIKKREPVALPSSFE